MDNEPFQVSQTSPTPFQTASKKNTTQLQKNPPLQVNNKSQSLHTVTTKTLQTISNKNAEPSQNSKQQKISKTSNNTTIPKEQYLQIQDINLNTL